MLDTTRKLCVNAIGVALFVVLTLCVQVPVFENYYICLGYVVMALYCYTFGTLSGVLVGCAGTVLYCVITGGLNGMPGWTLGNAVIGIIFGMVCQATKNINNKTIKYILLIITIVISTGIGILGVKSLVEVLLYAHPFWIRVAKNMPAFIADIVVLIISIPVCAALQPQINKIIGGHYGSKIK